MSSDTMSSDTMSSDTHGRRSVRRGWSRQESPVDAFALTRLPMQKVDVLERTRALELSDMQGFLDMEPSLTHTDPSPPDFGR